MKNPFRILSQICVKLNDVAAAQDAQSVKLAAILSGVLRLIVPVENAPGSSEARFCVSALVAQSAEQPFCKRQAGGSNPTRGIQTLAQFIRAAWAKPILPHGRMEGIAPRDA